MDDETTPDESARRAHDGERDMPTTNEPLNAPGRRPLLKPLLYLLAFLVVLFLLYLFGVAVLVPAD